MRSKFKWIFTLLLALTMQFSFAQEKTITGVVSDASGPLPGVNVTVKGTKRGVSTGFDGSYSIKAKEGETLVYSFMGMREVTKVVGASNVVNTILQDNSKQLGEVVVQGYGKKTTKAKSTAASTTVSAEAIQNRPNVTFLQSLQGQAPGLQVSTNSGSPGSAKINMLIRGTGSLTSDTEPLIVLDGIPVNSAVYRSINPEDIETTSILKDAIATSIYGNRGANGVIVVTTKRGKFGSKFGIEYSSTIGFTRLPKNKYNMANAQEALTLERTLGYGAGAGGNPYFNDYFGINPTQPLTDAEINSYKSNDWTKDYFRTGVTTNHNLGVTVNTSNLSSYTSLSYTNQDGVANTTDFKRATFRSNINAKTDNEKLTFASSVTGAFSRRHQFDQETNANINNNSVQNPLLGSLMALPYFSPKQFAYTGSGINLYNYIGTDFDYGNSNLVLQDVMKEGNLPNRFDEMKFLLNLESTYKFNKSFSYTFRGGIDFNEGSRIFARAPWSYLAEVVKATTPPPGGPQLGTEPTPFGGFETMQTDMEFGANLYHNLGYKTVFAEKHSIDAGLSLEWIKAHRRFRSQQQNGLDPKFYVFGAGTGYTNVGALYPSLRPVISAAKIDAALLSYFATLNYDYDGKYGLDLLARRDGSYKFKGSNKWGDNWAAGARWNVDKETFMQGSVFRTLKLRASYGTQGNQNLIEAVEGANPLLLGATLTADLAGPVTGYGNAAGSNVTQIGVESLIWENQAMANVGIDFNLKDRLTGAVDVYNRRTIKLYASNPTSALIGGGTQTIANGGVLQNRGIEVSLKYSILKSEKGLNLDIFANGAYNNGKIIEVDRRETANFLYENGAMIDEYYLQPYLGVNPTTGNPQFAGVDGTPQDLFNNSARVKTGKSRLPKYVGGFGLNADYKGFFLDSQFSFAKDLWRIDGAMIWLNNPSFIGDNNVSADLLNAWTPTNTNTNIPSLTATNNDATLFQSNDRFLRDASFLRLKNIMFGYSMTKEQLKMMPYISSVKIFVQGENLYTWTKWRGFDPESTNVSNLGQYPLGKVFTFGVNVGL